MRRSREEPERRQGSRKGPGMLGLARSPASMDRMLLGLGARRRERGGCNVTSKELDGPML